MLKVMLMNEKSKKNNYMIRLARIQRGAANALVGVCWVFSALLLADSAQAQVSKTDSSQRLMGTGEAGAQSRPDVLGDRFVQQAGVVSSQTRVVIYRLQDGRPGVTGIFVNKRYHSSLLPGSWSQLCYGSGKAELATRQTSATASSVKDRYDAISMVALQPGQVQYMSVDMGGGQPVLRPVASSQALQDLASTREQLNTVSRAAQDCIEAAPSQAIAPSQSSAATAQSYTLAADTLFGFNRSDRAGISDAGINAIDNLLARLRSDFSRIDSVKLVGHADPLGLEARNDQLSVERSQTVRDYIVQSGQLQQVDVTAEGRGSRELVVRRCGTVVTPQAIACNQPNRRVAVEVNGVRR